MKLRSFLFVFFLSFIVLGLSSDILAQSEPVLYFCERYDDDKGEINVSDRFTTGYLTVMVKCAYALNLEDCHIQFDKYDFRSGDFEFYKKFDYTIEPDMKYVFFKRNSTSDMKFDEPGFYRVYLLDDRDKTIASALIEIIED